MRYGSVGDAYPNAWTTVFTAYAYALVVDFTEVRVLLRDRLFLLDKPIVTETFAGFGGLSGTGIANKKQQMVLGRPGLIPLVLIDQNLQIYWMQANGASARQWLYSDSVDYHVFDGGVPMAGGAPTPRRKRACPSSRRPASSACSPRAQQPMRTTNPPARCTCAWARRPSSNCGRRRSAAEERRQQQGGAPGPSSPC